MPTCGDNPKTVQIMPVHNPPGTGNNPIGEKTKPKIRSSAVIET